jgi:phospho-N-acetylmuramoyl-pentapeptide-transferase
MSDVVRALLPAAFTFCIGIAMTPILTHYLYKYKAWKKNAKKMAYDGTVATVFDSIHNGTQTRAPRFGGVVIWGSVLIAVSIFWALARFGSEETFGPLDFLTRSQTWVPFAALLVGALVGFIDDLLIIRPPVEGGSEGNGLRLRWRLLVVSILSFLIGWWFFDKLDVTAINIPFNGALELGILIVPFFVLLSLALFASGVIDGIDGLSGGVFASVFASYGIIAFTQSQIDLAAFCAAIVGGLLAFIWFNIPPARFYMSDTGTMALTLAIPVIAFMTDSLGEGVGIAVLPIIGALLFITVASDVLQLISKKVFGKKIFRIAPLHHHFEALGWPGEKVVMRYWVLSIVFAFIGVIIAIISRQ